ncbi:MAG: PIG-L family deacetylase [Acidobacteria bacterium]|nr:PIG-L family deacetylase [Acidobacteriota bacterium]MBK9963818.1 PIG-L family deacetylase [Holophagales bacterium]
MTRRPLRFLAAAVLFLASGAARAAAPSETLSAAEIALQLKKLNVVGSVLYVAAHPDDENTAFLAWGAKGRLLETGYLSVTRGDGGQNLIGNETGELVGVLRTQELLAARRIDGARQFFTRAIDFGYSKNPEETFAIWGHEQVLSDVVWIIRSFRPDVIVTRFPSTGEGGHGNHTASAILAGEAFAAAADPKRFPEQLKWVRTWQARRIFWNVFRFGADAPRTAAAGQIAIDLGAYNALLGRSYTEIAGQSRSMHKSQGFGAAERRGTWMNDFKLTAGEPATSDLFEGVDLSWKRYGERGEEVGEILRKVEEGFRETDPAASVPALVQAWTALGRMSEAASEPPNSPSKKSESSSSSLDPLLAAKRAEVVEAIRACLGLWTEAIAADVSAAPGAEVKVATMILNRSSVPATLEKVEVTHAASPLAGGALAPNGPVRGTATVALPPDAAITQPYWLSAPAGKGLYAVPDPTLVGRPENAPPLVARFTVQVAGASIPFETPVVFRRTDPVKGEVYRPFEITPPVTANFDDKVYAFGSGAAKTVRVTLVAGAPKVSGSLRLKAPAGFHVSPSEVPFELAARGEEKAVAFTLTPPSGHAAGTLTAETTVAGKSGSRAIVRVDYPHIPVQTLFPAAEARVLRIDVKAPRLPVGYVMGSGDAGPDALRQMGYAVTLLSDDELETGDLSRYSAVVAGIRAFNTRPRLKQAVKRLEAYAEGGGTVVVQYNTTGDLVTDELGPWPIKLSRDRVTVEEAPVTFTKPDSPLLNFPNKLAPADFDGWVQERGLYFAGSWDPKYETVLATHDPGESDKPGGLLYGRVGKGAWVYTGYAFFRQLPAGVPGAYRLFVNLVSAGAGADLATRAPGAPASR